MKTSSNWVMMILLLTTLLIRSICITRLETLIKDNTSTIYLETPGTYTFEVIDIEEVVRICKKHNDRVPIVVCRNAKDDNIADIDKQKFLVPKDMTIGQFVYVIRKRINIKSEKIDIKFYNKIKT